MSVVTAPYYWLECDDCGAKSTEGGEFSAWSDINGAQEDAYGSDWERMDGKDYCSDCYPKHDPALKEEPDEPVVSDT